VSIRILAWCTTFGLPEPKFQAANEAGGLHRNRQHEDVKCVGPFGRQRVRLRQRDDEIRRPELPAFGPLRLTTDD